MLVRRDRPASPRFLAIRVGLFFLGAGIWVAGYIGENAAWTGTAVAVILAGVVLGIVARRNAREDEVAGDDDTDEPDPGPD